MGSSYGKHTWFHQTVGVLSFLLIALSYALLHSKQIACTTPLLPREELFNWVERSMTGIELSVDSLRARNQTEMANEMADYVVHYYDLVAYFHWIVLGWCGAILLLSWINIIPKQEDAKVFTILTTIFIMGIMALFTLYTAYIAFEKPCKETSSLKSGSSVFIRLYHQFHEQLSALAAKLHQSNSTKPQCPSKWLLPERHFKLEFRALKDKRPVNVYEDEDDTMIYVTLINATVGFVLLCSNFLFFFDSRQHMIEWRN